LASFVATSVGGPGPVVGGVQTWLDITEASFPPCGAPTPTCLAPNNGPAPTTINGAKWGQEKEVTRMDRMVKNFYLGGTNFTDLYYPVAGPSVTSVSGVCTAGVCSVGNVGAPCSSDGQCSQAINLDSSALSIGRGRRDIENLTKAANINIPVISFGGTNGLATVPGTYSAFGVSIGVCTAPSCNGTPRVVDRFTPNPAFPTFGGVARGVPRWAGRGPRATPRSAPPRTPPTSRCRRPWARSSRATPSDGRGRALPGGARPLSPAIGLEHAVEPLATTAEEAALLGMREHVEVAALDGAHDAPCDLLDADHAALHRALHLGTRIGSVDRVARVAERRRTVAHRVPVDVGLHDHRAEDADADAERPALPVERLRQADDGELGRAVDAEPFHADEAAHRGGVYDMSSLPLGNETGGERLHAVDDAPEVHPHGVIPVRGRGVDQVTEDGDAGVVAHHVDSPEALDGGGGQRLDLRRLAHVRRDREHVGAGGAERGRGALQRRGIDVREHDAGAAGGEGGGHTRADAA